ncbi:MAG: FapA family protein [Spirochaetes bacterium]|nr:FapA family protein [Spirochaetota bacterium]
MGDLKSLLKSLDVETEDATPGVNPDEEIEVYSDSVKQALELSATEFGTEISMLEYEIVEKGTRGFIGIGRRPYRLTVRRAKTIEKYKDLLEIDKKLSAVAAIKEKEAAEESSSDGSFKVRVTKTGIWLTVTPPKKRGRRIELNEVVNQIISLRINNADNAKVEKAIKNASGKPVKIGEWIPNPDLDGTMSMEISEDEMRAYVHFVKPKYSGRNMDTDDIIEALRSAGVVVGIKDKEIIEYLNKMDYNEALIAAEGTPPKHGKDAYVDYKVRIDKTHVVYEEDEKGQVDFKDLDLLENVVVGQLLAVKIPAEEGIQGRTLTNRILPAKSGKDIQLKYGKGTILSEDGLELTAEINGQVVYNMGKISVEPVHIVKGDVSLQTGNIIFLGSVLVTGNVQDNFTVKAAGNIEVKGSVQKAYLEAEGNIIVKQGIVGRDDAKIESTGGSIFAKFIQTANVIAEKDVIAAEGIVHANVDAGQRVLCNGKRAKIVGGVIRAGDEVNAKFLGSDAFTKTEIRVGVNPKVLQQVTDLMTVKQAQDESLAKIKLDLNTLTIQKRNSGGKLPPDKEETLAKMMSQKQKTMARLNEIELELEELRGYMGLLGQKGKVCAEKNIFPGVEIFIKDARFLVKDPYTNIKFTEENGNIRLSEYEPPQIDQDQIRMFPQFRRRQR